jgi:hypothetical protein
MAANVSGSSNNIQISQLPSNTAYIIVNGANVYLKNKTGKFSPKDGFADGYYYYQILAETDAAKTRKAQKKVNQYKMTLNNGREPGAKPTGMPVSVVKKGGFRILNGRLIELKKNEKEAN